MMRMPNAAKLKAMSSSRFLILLMRTPGAGTISYNVTVGPTSAEILSTSILKFCRVRMMLSLLTSSSSAVTRCLPSPWSASLSMLGSWNLGRSSVGSNGPNSCVKSSSCALVSTSSSRASFTSNATSFWPSFAASTVSAATVDTSSAGVSGSCAGSGSGGRFTSKGTSSAWSALSDFSAASASRLALSFASKMFVADMGRSDPKSAVSLASREAASCFIAASSASSSARIASLGARIQLAKRSLALANDSKWLKAHMLKRATNSGAGANAFST